MSPDLVQVALEFLTEYGLVAVFVLLVLDGAMLLPVLPGEVVMIMAVARYARSPADLVVLIALATAAAMVGSLMLFGVARAGGRRLVESHPRLFMMDRRRRERLERVFSRPIGQALVLFLRLIPFTRVLVNIPAGLAKMKLGRFVVLSAIGMVAFHAGFMYLAYEYRQPGSEVAAQAAAFQDAYASPAWEFAEANRILTALVLLCAGAVLSARSSVRIARDPEAGTRSLLGWLATRALAWGGIAVLASLYVAPGFLYEYAASGGLDLNALARRMGTTREELVVGVAVAATVVGALLIAAEKGAVRHRALWRRAQARARPTAAGPGPASPADGGGPTTDAPSRAFER